MAQQNKNVKVLKMVEFIKLFDQQPHRFSTPWSSLALYAKEKKSSEKAALEEWVISLCLGDNDKSLGAIFV